jgi:hypothetical protein
MIGRDGLFRTTFYRGVRNVGGKRKFVTISMIGDRSFEFTIGRFFPKTVIAAWLGGTIEEFIDTTLEWC